MEDGSKSTDPANADKFKKPKKQKLGEAAKKKAGKQKKSEEESSEDDDDEPKLKKGPTAWGLYVVAECKRLKEEDSTLKQPECFKLCGVSWAAMDEAARKPWTDKSVKEKEILDKYQADMTSKGYFTLPDGSKSTEAKNAGMFKKKKKVSLKKKLAKEAAMDDDVQVPAKKNKRKELRKSVHLSKPKYSKEDDTSEEEIDMNDSD